MITKSREQLQALPLPAATPAAVPAPVVPHQTPPPFITLRVPARRAAIAVPSEGCHAPTARHFVAALLVRWGVAEDDRDSAVLVVGELVANTAQHGRPDTTVALSLANSTLHIEVTDSGNAAGHTAPAAALADDEHGRGLHIVDALAERVEITEGPALRRTSVELRVERTFTPRRARRAA